MTTEFREVTNDYAKILLTLIVLSLPVPLFFYFVWSMNSLFLLHIPIFWIIFGPLLLIKKRRTIALYFFFASLCVFFLNYLYFVLYDSLKYMLKTGHLIPVIPQIDLNFIIFFLYPFLINQLLGLLSIFIPSFRRSKY